MGKLYTLDERLLASTPEIELKGKRYPVDDRKKTVEKIMKRMERREADSAAVDEALKLALGSGAFQEIDALNLPWPAYQRLFELVVAAMTGEEPDAVAARFQGPAQG